VSEQVYVLGDADRIRERIEGYLLGDTPAEVRTFSERLAGGLREFVRSAEILLNADVLMAGGDDVLLCVKPASYSRHTLEELAKTFCQATGCTISLGVGSEVSTAYLNLRRAKAAGGGVIAGDPTPT
jgi:minimal CRISPR polymerase domain